MDDKDNITIDLDDLDLGDTIAIDTDLSWYSGVGQNLQPGNITISSTANNYGSAYMSSSASAGNWSSSVSSNLNVEGDAEFRGDIKWQGRSLGALLEKIESRLAILTPDLDKLEHFAALKKAYDNYKMLEKLCELPVEDADD